MLVAFIAKFVEKRPTMKGRALNFLLLIGMALVTDAGPVHIPRGHLYFAVAFSSLVEAMNRFTATDRKKERAGGTRFFIPTRVE